MGELFASLDWPGASAWAVFALAGGAAALIGARSHLARAWPNSFSRTVHSDGCSSFSCGLVSPVEPIEDTCTNARCDKSNRLSIISW